jgi:hypothetical protein
MKQNPDRRVPGEIDFSAAANPAAPPPTITIRSGTFSAAARRRFGCSRLFVTKIRSPRCSTFQHAIGLKAGARTASPLRRSKQACARNAQRLFAKQEPREKRRLLNFLLSNCTWEDGEVVATLRQPFDLLAETALAAARAAVDQTAKTAKTEIWLPFLDTYRTMCHAPEPALRRIFEDIRELHFVA